MIDYLPEGSDAPARVVLAFTEEGMWVAGVARLDATMAEPSRDEG